MVEIMESCTEIAVLEKLSPESIFAEGGTNFIFESIKKEVATYKADIDTEEGRKECAALAYKVARSKTFIDNMGKVFNSDLKAKTKAVDQERSRIWDKLEALQKDVRKPLTEWEEIEEKRQIGHKAALSDLQACGVFAGMTTVSEINDDIASVAFFESRDWQEHANFVAPIIKEKKEWLAKLLEAAIQLEKDQAELEQLRRLKAESEAKEAADKEEQERAEREELIRQNAATDAQRAAQEAIDKANEARLAAEKEAELATLKERQRVEQELKQKLEADRLRAADLEHRGRINREACAAIAKLDPEGNGREDRAKAIVTAIAQGLIPHVKISY